MFLIARKHRISFFAFCLAVLICVSSICTCSFKVYASEIVITTELTEQLLLKLASKMASEYVEDVVKDKIQNDLGIDPAPVVSSSSFVNWNEPERVKEYIENYGSQRLAETWSELNSQFLKMNGTVDNEYYIAFYRSLINDIITDTNSVLDEINNDYVNNLYNYAKLTDAEKEAFLQFPIYLIVVQKNNSGNKIGNPELLYCADLYYGISTSYSYYGDSVYIWNKFLGDVGASVVCNNYGYREFSYIPDYFYDTIFTQFDTISANIYDFSKVDNSDGVIRRVRCRTYPLYRPELSSYNSASGYDIVNVGLTPKGQVMRKNGTSDEHLKSTLDNCAISPSQLPIFIQKPDSDGDSVDDYVGNDNTTILQLDVDNDDVFPNFVLDNDSTTIQSDDDVDNLDVSPVSEKEKAMKTWGWLSFLFDWFQKIIDAILSLVNGIVDGILSGLKGLFVPSNDFFTSNFSSIKDKLAEKFGFSDYELFFSALKNCAKGAWNFEFTFHVAEKEYTLAIANVDEWFKDANLSKLHFIVRGFFYPLIILANINYVTWFLRGTYLIAPSGKSSRE